MEEIIIDGVDVSGCNYYEQIQGGHGIRHCCSLYADKYGDYTIDCDEKETENCHYKQLKRKEKEHYETLKLYKDICIKYIKYKQALQEIKEIANTTYNDGVWNGYLIPEKLRIKIIQIISDVEA